MSEFLRRAPAHAAAFIAVAAKAWRMQWREGWFWRIGILGALALTLPVVLNARAMAGPDESQAARFAAAAGTDNYLAFTAVGVVVMAWIATTMQAVSVALASERHLGTLSTAWTTRTPRTLLLAADATGRALTQTWFGAVMFAMLWALVRFELTVVPAGLVLVLLTSFTASIAVGVFLVGFIMRHRDAGMLASTVIFASAVLAGIAYPTSVLPGWAQALGQVLPITWIARGLRAALVFGNSADAYVSAAVLLATTLVLGVIGWQLFARLDRATRRRGLLEAF